MTDLLKNLANLLRLRGGPQDFPSSWKLTISLLAIFIFQNLMTSQRLEDDNSAARLLLAIGLQVLVLAGLLLWRQFSERFAQTLSALVGVGIVFNAITWILLTRSDPTEIQPALAMAWYAVFIWSLFVDANIYRHALSITLPVGMLVTVLTLAAGFILNELLFLRSP